MSVTVKIDMSKVNLTERDIEDWLYENPQQIPLTMAKIVRWAGRQYQLPSGIADLVGITDDQAVAVVEVKNVPISKAAVLQVNRYAADLQRTLHFRNGERRTDQWGGTYIYKILIGPSIDNQTYTEAVACGVDVIVFNVRYILDMGQLGRPDGYFDSLNQKCCDIARRKEWDGFGEHWEHYSLADMVQGIGIKRDEYDELMDAISDDEEANDGNEAEL